MKTNMLSEKLAKWIGEGLRRERHNDDFRGARVDLTYREDRDGERTQNEIVLLLSNGDGLRMRVQPFQVVLAVRVDTPERISTATPEVEERAP